jgi:hypothetical protein
MASRRLISRYDCPAVTSARTFGASLPAWARCPGCRPNTIPRARAAAMPERTRSRSRSRSNSASAAIIVAISLPCGVLRSNCSPVWAINDTRHDCKSFNVWNRSSVERPQRVSSVTRITSISPDWANASTAFRWTRSSLAPQAVSFHTPASHSHDAWRRCAGLVGCRHPAIQRRLLSQLNPLHKTRHRPACGRGKIPVHSKCTSTGTFMRLCSEG